jgi:hypothetical protein
MPHLPQKSHSVPTFDRRALEGALVAEGVHREMDVLLSREHIAPGHGKQQAAGNAASNVTGTEASASTTISTPPLRSADRSPHPGLEPQLSRMSTRAEEEEQYLAFRPEHSPSPRDHALSNDEAGRRGHAHDPLQDHLYLYIGPSTFSGASDNADRRATFAADGQEEDVPIVSESPGAADIDIYETAYRDEIERIRQRCHEEGKDEETTVYLTRRVDARLLAVGQLAGRFMAKGEEGLDRFHTATGWKDKKARVTDVSRALRAAAREEYEKRRQERRQKYRQQAAPSETASPSEEQVATTEDHSPPKEVERPGIQPAESGAERSWSTTMFTQPAFAGRAVEKGRQAKTSFKSLMGMMKERGSASKDGNDAT